MNSQLMDKLKELRFEEMVWILYIGIIIFSFYSNSLEKHFFCYHDISSKEKYQRSLILIFSILIIVYLSFFKSSYEDILNLSDKDTSKKKKLVWLSFLASFLITISGVIYLYISLQDQDLNVEVAFN